MWLIPYMSLYKILNAGPHMRLPTRPPHPAHSPRPTLPLQYVTNGDATNSTAISISLFLIVLSSVLAGTALPFGLARMGIDPANAGTTVQVVMDCLGVFITCACCHFLLDLLAQGVGVA
jgi:hypothetical protein